MGRYKKGHHAGIEVAFNFIRKALYITQSTGKKISLWCCWRHITEQNRTFHSLTVRHSWNYVPLGCALGARIFWERDFVGVTTLNKIWKHFLAIFLLRFISNSSSPSSKFALPLAQVWFLLVQIGVWRVFECLNNRWLWVF
jgi:hypothetical protein